MILVIGSRASGKTTYVHNLGFAPADVFDCAAHPDDALVFGNAPVVDNVQDAVAVWLASADADISDVVSGACDASFLVEELCKKDVVVCAEVGNGVIPADAFGRQWREQTGRLCVMLAQRADVVVRMVCGIPCLLKGDTLPSLACERAEGN